MFPLPIPSALAIKLGVYAGMAAAVVFAVFMVVHSIQAGAVKDIVAQDAKTTAQAATTGAKIDAASADVDAQAASSAATHQTALAAQAAVIHQKVKSHVHEAPPGAPLRVGCVSVGLVRQHDAAALGVDPDTLPLPAGATDDACSSVTNSDLASAISDNYAAARANAQELTDLQNRDRAQAKSQALVLDAPR
jgi:hypothetical protein